MTIGTVQYDQCKNETYDEAEDRHFQRLKEYFDAEFRRLDELERQQRLFDNQLRALAEYVKQREAERQHEHRTPSV